MVDREQVRSENVRKYSYIERSVRASAHHPTLPAKTYDSKPRTTAACTIVTTMKAHVQRVFGVYMLDRRSGV